MQVTVSFFDALKLREHVRLVEAIIEEGEYCVDGTCFGIDAWSLSYSVAF